MWLDAGANAVLSQGGTLDKFIGDAVMAVFGAPLPLPNPALSAVRCALAMRAALEEISSRTNEPLAITIGINSGPVLAGSVGSARRLEYTVLGDTVNVAARLQSNAGTNEILISDSTREALGDSVEVERVGELALKNRTRPVDTFRVVRIRP
jgi:adenylate cyclase